jgi:hypothetical protein
MKFPCPSTNELSASASERFRLRDCALGGGVEVDRGMVGCDNPAVKVGAGEVWLAGRVGMAPDVVGVKSP